MLARNQRPRTVFVPLLRGHLNVGDFVHVKEVQGRDAGPNRGEAAGEENVHDDVISMRMILEAEKPLSNVPSAPWPFLWHK